MSIRYRVRGVIGYRRILGPVTAGDFVVPGAGGGASYSVMITSLSGDLPPILLEVGASVSANAGIGVTSTGAGNATVTILASVGSGSFSAIGSTSEYVGPGEPAYPEAAGTFTNTTGARTFVTLRAQASGPSGLAVRSDTTNYLQA